MKRKLLKQTPFQLVHAAIFGPLQKSSDPTKPKEYPDFMLGIVSRAVSAQRVKLPTSHVNRIYNYLGEETRQHRADNSTTMTTEDYAAALKKCKDLLDTIKDDSLKKD
jgi:hypothetical protein